MPDADTVRSRQRNALILLIAIPVVIVILYLVPVAVNGTVTDAESTQSLAGVAVQIEGREPLQAGPDGRFSLRAGRLGGLTAAAEASGYQTWQGRARFPILPLLPARLTVDMAPTRVQGVVVDGSNGAPLAGAQINIGAQRVASDAAGHYQLQRLPAGPATLQAQAAGFIDFQRSVVVDANWDGSEPLPVEMLPNGLRGQVLDGDSGQPLAGALLRFEDKAAQSGADGAYYISHLSGPAVLEASLPGYLPAAVAVQSPAALQGSEAVDVSLAPTLLAGQVSDGRTGEPLAGVALEIDGQSVSSDGDGRFQFQRLHGAGLALSARLTGYDPAQVAVSEQDNLLGGQALDLALAPRHLDGQVLNEVTGSPLAGATAIAGDKVAQSDEEGRFVLWGAEPPVTVFISADGFFDAERQVTDTSEHQVSLKPRHAVITLEDQVTGERLAGVRLVGPRSESVTDAQGVALLRLLDPGEQIQVDAEGFAPVSIAYDGSDQVVLQTYRDTLAGNAVDGETGQGIPGAILYVYDGDLCQGIACRGTVPVATADAALDGSFTVDGLPANPQLMIKAPGYDLFFPQDLAAGGCGAPFCLTARMAPFEARGFYLPFHVLYNRGLVAERLDFVAQSPFLNAVVVDMKSDFGELAWQPRYPVAQDLGVYQPDVMSAEEFLQMANERGIYTIARFVTFKDDPLAKGRPEWAVRKKSEPGTVWLDGESLAWVDPYRAEVREYEIELAKELAALGFDELQFDYFRFTGQDHTQFIFQVESTVDNRREAISSFADELMAELKPYGVFTSIDVFGSIILVGQEPLIGQNLVEMSRNLDYLSPMIYPQVWWPGSFPPYDDPVFYPYEVIYDSVANVRELIPLPTRIRPWLQGYPNNYRPHGYNYGVPEMMIQRLASDDAGGEGWLFWSGGGNFPWEIFGPMPSLAELRAQVAARQGQLLNPQPTPEGDGGS